MKALEFNYQVVANNQIIDNNQVSIDVSEQNVREVAASMKLNGGFPVTMTDLRLSEKILEAAYLEYGEEHEEVDWDNTKIVIEDEMPQELIDAASDFIKEKDVTFSVTSEGKEHLVYVTISNDTYKAMMKHIMEEHDGMTDIEFLKLKEYDAYEEVMTKVTKTVGDASLSMFPSECYENI